MGVLLTPIIVKQSLELADLQGKRMAASTAAFFDDQWTRKFLCDEREFSEEHVKAALERAFGPATWVKEGMPPSVLRT